MPKSPVDWIWYPDEGFYSSQCAQYYGSSRRFDQKGSKSITLPGSLQSLLAALEGLLKQEEHSGQHVGDGLSGAQSQTAMPATPAPAITGPIATLMEDRTISTTWGTCKP